MPNTTEVAQPMSSTIKTFKIINIILFTLDCFLQLVGIIFLNRSSGHRRKKDWKRNQRIILTNLSCVHSCFAIIQIYELSTQITSYKPTTIQTLTVIFVRATIATCYPLYMHFIALDRFFEVYFHLRYPLIFTRRRVFGVLVLIWSLSCTSGGYRVYLQHTNLKQSSRQPRLIFITLSGSVLITFVVVYGYLYLKWRSFRTKRPKVTAFHMKRSGRKGSGHFLVPALIVLTFILFELAGSALNVVQKNVSLTLVQEKGVRNLVLALFSFGGMSDVVIYIVLEGSRKSTLHTSRKTFRRRRDEEQMRKVFTRKNIQNMDKLRSTTPAVC